jgi:hypothetical protein
MRGFAIPSTYVSAGITGSRRAVAAVVAAIMLAVAAPADAQDDADPLLDALRLVPSAAIAASSSISYIDYDAVAAARPGALAPTSLAELLARQDADDPAAALWFAAAQGIASGPSDLLASLFVEGPSWPEAVGFDFTDIGRAVTFGSPPSNGTVLLGTFDAAAIAAAYEARGYSSAAAGDRTLLCPPDGCDAGMAVDLANRDTRVPFGGRLGRLEPLVASDTDMLSSADGGVIEEMLATADASLPSVADAAPFRVAATAPTDDLAIIQATLLPAALAVGGPNLGAMLIEPSTEGAGAVLQEVADLPPLPAPSALAIVDGATPTEQVLTIALAYPVGVDVGAAAVALAERLETARSIRADAPLGDLLDERGVTAITPRPSGAEDAGFTAAVVELRAPLEGTEASDTDRPSPSSALYRLFMDLVLSRDLLWLTPTGPPA